MPVNVVTRFNHYYINHFEIKIRRPKINLLKKRQSGELVFPLELQAVTGETCGRVVSLKKIFDNSLNIY